MLVCVFVSYCFNMLKSKIHNSKLMVKIDCFGGKSLIKWALTNYHVKSLGSGEFLSQPYWNLLQKNKIYKYWNCCAATLFFGHWEWIQDLPRCLIVFVEMMGKLITLLLHIILQNCVSLYAPYWIESSEKETYQTTDLEEEKKYKSLSLNCIILSSCILKWPTFYSPQRKENHILDFKNINIFKHFIIQFNIAPSAIRLNHEL